MNDTIQKRFDEMYGSTYNYVLKFVISKCDNLDNIEDIMQNIYVKLYLTIEKNSFYVDNPRGFLIKLAKNELFNYYSLKNKLKVIACSSLEGNDKNYIEEIVDENINIEADFVNRFNNEIIWNEIQKENLTSKKILALHFLEDMKLLEIAEVLNLPESTVKSKMYRSLKKIKNRLEEQNI